MPSLKPMGVWLTAALLAGCAGEKVHLRSPTLSEHPPQRVAVLPFLITMKYHGDRADAMPAEHQLGREVLRQTFYHNFAVLGYEDVPLATVDAALAALGSPTPQQLGQRLGVDAVITGEITRIQSSSTLVYTGTAFEVILRMVDTRNGETLWQTRVKEAEEGGLLLQKGQAADFVKDQARSHQDRVMFQRAADVVARRALRKLPNPARTLAQAQSAAQAAVGHATKPRLAVLPFTAEQAGWLKAAGEMRAVVAATLHEGAFELIEPRDVEVVAQALWGTSSPTTNQLQSLARQLRADLLLQGTATQYGRTYLLVHSQVSAGLQLALIDPQTGATVWEDEESRTRRAGLLKIPTGLQSIALSPIKGLKGKHLKRVGTHVARELAEAMVQAPEVQRYLHTSTAQQSP